MSRLWTVGLLVVPVIGALAPATPARAASGGASYARPPKVTALRCATGETSQCPQGQLLRIGGESLQLADNVVFLGREGRGDDQAVQPDKRSPHRLVVRVPPSAKTGPLRVVSKAAGRSRASRRLRVSLAKGTPQLNVGALPAGEGIFPVRGAYTFGTEVNAFGGGRGHQGQDILASCGLPVVAARSGVVTAAKFQDRAGNYAVITADDGTSQTYMHMLAPATVKQDQRVTAGQPVGQVGQTGRATACHLHFELWTAPGWYKGGKAVDPLPVLRLYAARG